MSLKTMGLDVKKPSSTDTKSAGDKDSRFEYQLIAFEDMSKPPRRMSYEKPSWTWTEPRRLQQPVTSDHVERAIKEQGNVEYIKALMSLGPKRRQLVQDVLLELNGSQASENPWSVEVLFTGKDITNKNGDKLRPPKNFWLIARRSRKSALASAQKDSAPKGILKDKEDSKGDKSTAVKRDSSKFETTVLNQHLIDGVTKNNTTKNSFTMDEQIQAHIQREIHMALAAYQQTQQMFQSQMNRFPPQALPPAPYVPGSSMFNNQGMSQRSSPQDSPTMHSFSNINNGFNSPYQQDPYMDPRYSTSRVNGQYDDDGLYNIQMNGMESSHYPGNGAGSRRGNMSRQYGLGDTNIPQQMSGYLGMNSHHQMGGMGGMGNRHGMALMGPHHQVELNRRLGGWESTPSTPSIDSSDDERGGRGRYRADSINSSSNGYNGPRSRGPSRSRSRGPTMGPMITDLSGGRRPSVHRSLDAMSEPDIIHDQRMIYQGSGVDRLSSRTPAPQFRA